jgi:murein L,D-transpeptidase YcbB/YkuD
LPKLTRRRRPAFAAERVIVKKKTVVYIVVLVVLLVLAVTAALACSGLRTTLAVKNFAGNAGAKVVDLYSPMVAKGDRLTEPFRALLQSRTTDGALLAAAYEADQFQFRFVVNQKTTPDHDALRDLLTKDGYAHGIEPGPYQLDKIANHEKALAESLKALDELSDKNLTEPESAALLDAVKTVSAGEVTTAFLVQLAEQSGNQGKFPNLQALVEKARAAAEQRDQAILQIELLDAANLLAFYREMGLADDQWAKAWTDSKKGLRPVFESLIPVSPHYANLLKELARYREIAKQPAPPKFSGQVKKGASGEYVREVQKRLAVEGYWDGPPTGLFDDTLEAAVKRFQDDRQVTADGKIEKVTLERLNVPMAERVKQIKLALHKLRHSATRNGDYFVRVNIGAQQLELYTDGGRKIERRHNIVVGNLNPKNHTPEFSDEIEQIIFYPPWNVPQRIIKEEMLPDLMKDPEYFKKHGYDAKIKFKPDGTVDKILSVTQPPGVRNALGVVKIDFPNKYDVYLHDTNMKHFFKRSVRTFSHGCMRLQNPVELVRYLLARDNNEYANKVDELLEKRRSLTVYLNKKVPIHIEYVTVVTNEQGRAVFCTDPYHRDADEIADYTAN